MKKNRNLFKGGCYFTFFTIILMINILLLFISFDQEVVAGRTKLEKHLEYKSQTYQEKLIIPAQDIRTISLDFLDGQALEFIFKLYVQEELPIDVWFVNDGNYTNFINGNKYNFFIDGSEKQVISTTNIVSVADYDTYKLILANYNETLPINVDIVYEGRVYDKYSTKTSSQDSAEEDSNFLLYLFIIIVIIVLALDIYINIRKSKQVKAMASKKTSLKKAKNKSKSKTNRTKKNKHKAKTTKKKHSKKSKSSQSKQPVAEIIVTTKSKKSKLKPITTTDNFCGYCGHPVSTPYCIKCGKQTHTAVVSIKN